MYCTELSTILRSLLQQKSLGYKMHPTFRPTESCLGPRAKQMGQANFALSALATQTSCTAFYPLLSGIAFIPKSFRWLSGLSRLTRTGGLYGN